MSAAADRLSLLLPELLNLLHATAAKDTLELWADNDLTMPQLIALHILGFGGPQTISGLQQQLALSASATSHMVDRLVAKGFVDRAEDPADRRQKLVRVTAAGQALSQAIAAARSEQLRRGLSPLPDDLLERLDAVCSEAVTLLRRHGARQCPGS